MAPVGISWGDTPGFLEGQTAPSIWNITRELAFIERKCEFDWGW